MRIAVMGAGGTGGYFGGLLARAGEDVTFIARGAHLEAMRTRGLTIKSSRAGDFTVPVQATDDPKGMEPVDLVLFCVKTYDTESAAKLIPHSRPEHGGLLHPERRGQCGADWPDRGTPDRYVRGSPDILHGGTTRGDRPSVRRTGQDNSW